MACTVASVVSIFSRGVLVCTPGNCASWACRARYIQPQCYIRTCAAGIAAVMPIFRVSIGESGARQGVFRPSGGALSQSRCSKGKPRRRRTFQLWEWTTMKKNMEGPFPKLERVTAVFFFFFQLGKSLEKKSHVLRFKFPTNTSSIIRCGSLHINNSTEMMIFLHRIKKL